MKTLFAALCLSFGLLVLASPATVSAHDTGKTHFHGEQLAQNQGHVCFRNCIEQNGSSAKTSCAMQCGVAGNAGQGMGQGQGGQRDCGTAFKQCRKACGADQACQTQCREARKNCY
tara:strand:+ start:290 stop:637 length:348 start_codon:yes stop_codon:yes gene_type:complete